VHNHWRYFIVLAPESGHFMLLKHLPVNNSFFKFFMVEKQFIPAVATTSRQHLTLGADLLLKLVNIFCAFWNWKFGCYGNTCGLTGCSSELAHCAR